MAKGKIEGITEGMAKGKIELYYTKLNYTIKQISDEMNLPKEDVQVVLTQLGLI
jgi:predicted transposase YdaD